MKTRWCLVSFSGDMEYSSGKGVGGMSVCRVWCFGRFLHVLGLRFPSHRCFCTCGYQVKENCFARGGLKAYYRLSGDHGEELFQARASSGYDDFCTSVGEL